MDPFGLKDNFLRDAPTFMDGYTRDKMLNYKVREDPSVPKEPSEIDQLVIETWTVATIGMIVAPRLLQKQRLVVP